MPTILIHPCVLLAHESHSFKEDPSTFITPCVRRDLYSFAFKQPCSILANISIWFLPLDSDHPVLLTEAKKLVYVPAVAHAAYRQPRRSATFHICFQTTGDIGERAIIDVHVR